MKKSRNQKIGILLFIVYLILLIYFLFFAESFGRTARSQSEYAYNLVLLREIKRFITYRDILGMKAFLYNIVGNIVAFMPFGFILSYICKKITWFGHAVCLTFIFSLCIEVAQLLCKVGSFDVDDLLLNTIGGLLGYLLYYLVRLTRRHYHAKH